MALVGYQIEKQRIEDKIGEIQALLKGKTVSAPASAGAKPKGTRRALSAAARNRISVAQKKRWAEDRKRKAQAAKEA
jgi:phage head maturation protease